MLKWSHRLALHQRILCLLIGGALLTVLIVAWSLYELSVLRGYIDAERAAERRSEVIHAAAILSYRAASNFAAVGLDLTPEERQKHLLEGDAMLREFEARQPSLRAVVRDSLDQAELQVLDDFIGYIRHSWDEAKEKLAPDYRDELQFHLIMIVTQTERVYHLIAKAEEAARSEVNASKKAFDKRVALATSRILLVLAVSLALGLVGGYLFLNYAVKRPLNEVIATLLRLARGDIESPVSQYGRTDQIGAIFAALAVLRENAVARKRLEEDLTRTMATGDARRHALEQNIAEFRAAVLAVLHECSGAINVMQEAAHELALAVEETEAGATNATGASHEVSSNVAGVAAGTKELSIGTGSMATSLALAGGAIEKATSRASVASKTIDSLSEVAQTIEDVTQFIDSIARQTNLLALNATIEAARAGESGRGFAVVASEVKSLAIQTAKATTDIAERIEEMRRRTGEVVDAIRTITETTGEANIHAARITAVVTQQNQVTAAISKSLQDAAGWTSGLSRVVDDLGSAVARTRAAVQKVEVASRETSAAAGKFNYLVDGFLQKVTAG